MVEDPEGGLEQLHLLGVELLASLPPFGVMIGGDGEGTRGEVGFAAGEELPEPPLYGEYGRLVPGMGRGQGLREQAEVVGEDAAVAVVGPRRVRLKFVQELFELAQQGGPGSVGASGADASGEGGVEGAGEA
ncbi:MAG: hypothetical protein ABGX90_03530 [Brachybacterium sp.]|uniref:hypothetical protein n=1 Tax=Brachybacterium sp. TaxID=1891286 RepID=UPI003242EFD7